MNLMMFLLVCAKTLIDRNWSMWSRENYVSQPFPPGEKKELIWSYYLPQRVVVRIMRLYINLPYPESLLYASIVLNSSDILCLTHSQSDISCVVCCPSCSRQNQICKSKILLIFKKIIFKKLIFFVDTITDDPISLHSFAHLHPVPAPGSGHKLLSLFLDYAYMFFG